MARRLTRAVPLATLRATREARETLARRADTCERLARSVVEARLGRTGIDRMFVEDALETIRSAEQSQIGRHVAYIRDWNFNLEREERIAFFAKRTPRGVVWDACAHPVGSGGPTTSPCAPPAAERFNQGVMVGTKWDWERWARDSKHQRIQCGCTDREMVAIDALLETGDKAAAKLAVKCRRGGGALEGTLKRKRRRK